MITDVPLIETNGAVDRSVLRMVSVLTEAEESDFFGGTQWTDELGAACEVDRRPGLSDRDWAAYLAEVRPHVAVGAWRAPRLPRVCDGQLPVAYYCHLAGSIRRVVSADHLRAGLLVTNWGNSIAFFVAEMALLLTLGSLRNAAARQIDIHGRAGWRGVAQPFDENTLFNKRVGIHGFGAIARELKNLLTPFRTPIAVWDPYVGDDVLRAEGVRPTASLEELFAQSDVLVECCALTPETEGIITEALLRRLPRGAVFVNIARGGLVDEEALARLAAEGHLRAGLDVFVQEPLPADSPLRGLDNVMMMPHTGGNTKESRHYAGLFGLENLRCFLRGETPPGRVTLDQYLRMT